MPVIIKKKLTLYLVDMAYRERKTAGVLLTITSNLAII